MAPLTQDRNTTRKEGEQVVFPVAAGVKIFAGAGVCLDAAGNAVPAADTAGLKFVGISRQYVDNTGGAAGDQTVLLWREGIFDFVAVGMTAADVGKPAFVTDDQTVALTSAHGVSCGIIAEVESATKVWVDTDEAECRAGLAQANSIAADVPTIVNDFNALLAKLRAGRFIAS